MKKKSTSQSAFFNLRVLIAAVFCLGALAVALFAQTKSARPTQQSNRSVGAEDAPGTQTPDVVQLIGPVLLNTDLRDLPYIAPSHEFEEKRLMRYPHLEIPTPTKPTSAYERFESLMKQILPPLPQMPGPLLTFDGMNSAQSGCMCLPPDTDGDVGPNHYVQSVNSSIKIFDKSGNPLNGANGTTYNSLFLTLVGTPCSGLNNGDGFVFYDHVADRWVASDFAFPGTLPGAGPFYQCVAVSQIRPTRLGSAITQSSRFGTAAGPLPKTLITSRSTCLTGQRLPSKACVFLLSTAPRCLLVVPLMRSLSTSRLQGWATPTAWCQLVFARAIRHPWAEMNFYYLWTALLRAA